MENLTIQQSRLLQVLRMYKDSESNASISIHDEKLYPITPDSINPALEDLEALKINNLIGSFERTSSRGVRVFNIT